ncbi:MAG TPA: AIR synthase related protein, partial [Synergistales bacterium]|nr:AIR synthase related protein [Synergistales bacterium]
DPPETARCLSTILEDPNLAERSRIYRQYDYMVQTNTVVPPGNSVSIFRVRENRSFVAVTMEVDPWKCSLDPFAGAAETFLKALRPLWVSGAKHLGMTNCLNFPSPEDPENHWILERSVSGLAAVARDLACPVVSGNVSLYNESPSGKILPSPLVAVVGLQDCNSPPLRDRATLEAGSVFLVGDTQGTLGGGAFSRIITPGAEHNPGDYVPLKEKDFMERALKTVRKEAAAAGRAIAGGGLMTSLAKMCIKADIGIGLDSAVLDNDPECLFGEWGPRAVYLVPERSTELFLSCWEGFPVRRIGEITPGGLTLDGHEMLPEETWAGKAGRE